MAAGMNEPDQGQHLRLPLVPVLNYHHVHNEAESYFRITPDRLRAQLEFVLEEGYIPIPASDLIGCKGSAQAASGSLVVTFDDAYEDFLNAWPILEELKIPATLFVVADCIGAWNDWDQDRPSARRHLDLPQLRSLRDQGLSFGSHTLSHRPLWLLEEEDLRQELCGSRVVLEERLQVTVPIVAYPGGAVNEQVRRAAAQCYDLGFATNSSRAACCDACLIPRFDPTFCPDLADFRRQLAAHGGCPAPPAGGRED